MSCHQYFAAHKHCLSQVSYLFITKNHFRSLTQGAPLSKQRYFPTQHYVTGPYNRDGVFTVRYGLNIYREVRLILASEGYKCWISDKQLTQATNRKPVRLVLTSQHKDASYSRTRQPHLHFLCSLPLVVCSANGNTQVRASQFHT